MITKQPRNLWKYAFFVMLFLFEGAREMVVAAEATPVTFGGAPSVYGYGGFVTAQGSWKRIGDGDKFTASGIQLSCREDTATCIEASSNAYDRWVSVPDIATFNATFSPDAVTFVDQRGICVRYDVRIDLKLQKVFAVRTRTNDKGDCARLEPRLEMQLGDGFERFNPTEDHFLPLIAMLRAVTVNA